MFYGQYQHSMDDKGRLTIPAIYRDALEGTVFITQGFDKNLMLMPSSYFEWLSGQINKLNIVDPNARLIRRLFLSTAFPVEVDKAGRLLMPPHHRAYFDGEPEMILVGQSQYIELWKPAHWNEQLANLGDTDGNIGRFAGLDLSMKE